MMSSCESEDIRRDTRAGDSLAILCAKFWWVENCSDAPERETDIFHPSRQMRISDLIPDENTDTIRKRNIRRFQNGCQRGITVSIVEYFRIWRDDECFFLFFESRFYFLETVRIRGFDKMDVKKSVALHGAILWKINHLSNSPSFHQ